MEVNKMSYTVKDFQFEVLLDCFSKEELLGRFRPQDLLKGLRSKDQQAGLKPEDISTDDIEFFENLIKQAKLHNNYA